MIIKWYGFCNKLVWNKHSPADVNPWIFFNCRGLHILSNKLKDMLYINRRMWAPSCCQEALNVLCCWMWQVFSFSYNWHITVRQICPEVCWPKKYKKSITADLIQACFGNVGWSLLQTSFVFPVYGCGGGGRTEEWPGNRGVQFILLVFSSPGLFEKKNPPKKRNFWKILNPNPGIVFTSRIFQKSGKKMGPINQRIKILIFKKLGTSPTAWFNSHYRRRHHSSQ